MRHRHLAILAASALLSAGASPSLAASSVERRAPETAPVERGTWWGFEFITCMAGGLSGGGELSSTASQCAVLALDEREHQPGEHLGTWWGFEF